MGVLRDFLNQTYANDPALAVKFVNHTIRLVRIGRHWYRGYKKMSDGVVEVAGRAVNEGATTKPSWKLMPKEVTVEFAAFEKSIEDLVSDECVTSVALDGESRPLVFGGGVYAVDVSRWPALNQKLKVLQAKWDEAANRWCTDDGYRELHEAIKRQIGDEEYAHVEKLVPPAAELRGRFWLEVTPLPFRLSEQVGDADEDRGRQTAVAELIEAAVKGPRDEAAASWSGMAAMLATVDNGTVIAYRPLKDNRDGTKSFASRRLRSDTVINARRAVDGLARCDRFHDAEMIASAALVRAEVSTDPGTASEIAKRLNAEDEEAVRVARVLVAAAAVAADESKMCAGVGAAMSGAPPDK